MFGYCNVFLVQKHVVLVTLLLLLLFCIATKSNLYKNGAFVLLFSLNKKQNVYIALCFQNFEIFFLNRIRNSRLSLIIREYSRIPNYYEMPIPSRLMLQLCLFLQLD